MIFSHPDFTVGSGITPDQSTAPYRAASRGLLPNESTFTAG
ncbi:hypothetical protein JOC58_002387 [Paenibacillus hunanensis]|uniref:Uncharacterized protein n=1 Tax=Paenibacillus hunanensis TaxID=539262 RepID=A0ABU1IZ14_9BACL|nr:hypothetical protein [Paenibacillus hunanensis]